jgi:hypothetical protein
MQPMDNETIQPLAPREEIYIAVPCVGILKLKLNTEAQAPTKKKKQI